MKFKEVINESSLSRIWSKTESHMCGTITAFRGNKSYAQNRQNNAQLSRLLREKGYDVTPVMGIYAEIGQPPKSEESFFVCDSNDRGNLVNDMFHLAENYEQDSILIIPNGGKSAYLLGTTRTPNEFLNYKQTMPLGGRLLGQIKDVAYTTVRGRPFSF
jgi:hypothetical protein